MNGDSGLERESRRLYPAASGAKAPQSFGLRDFDPRVSGAGVGFFSRHCRPPTLKQQALRADRPGMFSLSKDPLPLSEACLQGMCVSLNAPVVYGDDLPPGPARAAIVTYAEDYGDFGMAVGMRALEDGSVAVYRYREPIVDAAGIASALDAALIFAEGLGFLFDDDMIDENSRTGRREALEHWNRLMGDGEVFAAAGVVEPPRAPLAEFTLPGEGLDGPMEDLLAMPEGMEDPVPRAPGSELLLDELMDLAEQSPKDELLLEVEPANDPPPTRRPASAPAPTAVARPTSPATQVEGRVTLSKFRGQPAAPPRVAEPARPAATRPVRDFVEVTRPDLDDLAPDTQRPVEVEAVSGGAALGRIPIMRRRKVVEPERPGLLARLLASF